MSVAKSGVVDLKASYYEHDGIIMEVSNNIVTIIILAYLLLIPVLTMYTTFTIMSRIGKKRGKSKFFKSIDTKFELELIEDQSDIEILKSAIEREFGAVYSLAPLLEDYLVYLGEHRSQDSQISLRYKLIKGIIASENADKPFADIPEEERRLLITMRDAIQRGDEEFMSFNLNELSSVISTRSRDYEIILNANKWMKPLTIIGVAASIIFGVLALL